MVLFLIKESKDKKYKLIKKYLDSSPAVMGNSPYHYYFTTPIIVSKLDTTNPKFKSLENQKTHFIYINSSKINELFDNKEALKALSDFRDSKINLILDNDI